jgi:hypothetical protein
VYLHTFVGRNQELNESLVQYAAALSDLVRRALPNLNNDQRYAYLHDQFLAGLRNRDVAEKLAGLDIDDLDTLVQRAREQESQLMGLSSMRDNNRSLARKRLTPDEIRNLATPKLEQFQPQFQAQYQPQIQHQQYAFENPRAEMSRNVQDYSYMPMNVSGTSNYSNLLGHTQDGSYLNASNTRFRMINSTPRLNRGRCFNCNQEGHIRRNCPMPERNVQQDYYRLGFGSQNNTPLNQSTPMNRSNVQAMHQQRPSTNNVNEESEETNLTYVYGYIDNERIECLLDTGSMKTLVSKEVWNRIQHKNKLSNEFT